MTTSPGGPYRDAVSCGEEGFSVIETTVAGMLAVILVVGMGMSLLVAMSGARDSRMQQSAQAIALERMEAFRAASWDELQMSSIDPDAPLLNEAGTAIRGSDTGLLEDEVLSVATGGIVVPRAQEVRDSVTFTIWSYVTVPDRDTRRVLVEVIWGIDGRFERFVASTLVSEASA